MRVSCPGLEGHRPLKVVKELGRGVPSHLHPQHPVLRLCLEIGSVQGSSGLGRKFENLAEARALVPVGREALPLDSHSVLLQRKLNEVRKAGVPGGWLGVELPFPYKHEHR